MIYFNSKFVRFYYICKTETYLKNIGYIETINVKVWYRKHKIDAIIFLSLYRQIIIKLFSIILRDYFPTK